MLWIAFFLYLCHRSQHLINIFKKSTLCCELLSFCIFVTGHNTPWLVIDEVAQLWIAFFLYLCHRSQHLVNEFFEVLNGCELLSFCIFVTGHNTVHQTRSHHCVVVNCFLFVSLSQVTTPHDLRYPLFRGLWIAFFLYLCHRSQHPAGAAVSPSPMLWIAFFLYLCHRSQHLRSSRFSLWDSCELLSFCIFVTGHNTRWIALKYCEVVVNCFLFVSLSQVTTPQFG